MDLKQITTISLADVPLGVAVVCFYGLYRVLMTNLVLKRIAKIVRVKKEIKFIHRSFDLIHYTTSALLGIMALSNRPYGHCFVWAKNCAPYFLQNENGFVLTVMEKIYFMIFTAYYIVDIFYIWTANERWMMITHHASTLSMIFFSIALRVPVIGLVIMLLHDVVDVPLYFGKILLYLGYENAKDVSLVIFAILCTWFRMINYPFVVYNTIMNEPFNLKVLYNITCDLLCVLMVCHIIWYYKIISVVVDALKGGANKIRDNRSE